MSQPMIPAVKVPPPLFGGDQIELHDLMDRVCGVYVSDRRGVKTRFRDQDTPMSTVLIAVEGEKEPLSGVLFQDYFQGLELRAWYIGRIGKNGRAWCLQPVDAGSKEYTAMCKQIAAVKLPE